MNNLEFNLILMALLGAYGLCTLMALLLLRVLSFAKEAFKFIKAKDLNEKHLVDHNEKALAIQREKDRPKSRWFTGRKDKPQPSAVEEELRLHGKIVDNSGATWTQV